jgi:hypothetical protein
MMTARLHPVFDFRYSPIAHRGLSASIEVRLAPFFFLSLTTKFYTFYWKCFVIKR